MFKWKLSLRMLACAIAYPAAVLAQPASVEIFGTLLPFVDTVRTRGATGVAPSARPDQVPASAYTRAADIGHRRLTAGTSNIGFRGREDLGGGSAAVWQIEMPVSFDGRVSNVLAGRNSSVGLTSGIGTLILGNWDTPYKYISISVAPVRGMNPFDIGLIGNPGFGVPVTTTQSGRVGNRADAAFSRRQGNSIQYWTPNLGGLTVRAAYSFAEGKDVTNGVNISPGLWSAAAIYDIGRLSVRYAYERHNDYFGLAQIGGTQVSSSNASSSDAGHQLVASYQFGDMRMSGVLERLKYRSDEKVATAVNEYARNAWYMLLQQRFGAQQVWGAYGRAMDGNCRIAGGVPCSTTGLGAAQWSIGYSYSLSRRTEVYASFFGINARASSTYSVFPPVTQAVPGTDVRGGGVGLLHTF